MTSVDGASSLDALDDPPIADTPLWLAHHWPSGYDRCVRVAGRHVCRRCLVTYPLVLVAAVAVSLGSWWDHSWEPWLLWLAPLPGVVEFVADNTGFVRYSPWRQVAVSAPGGLAAGVGYVRYLDNHLDPLAISVLVTYSLVCLAGVLVGSRFRHREVAP